MHVGTVNRHKFILCINGDLKDANRGQNMIEFLWSVVSHIPSD